MLITPGSYKGSRDPIVMSSNEITHNVHFTVCYVHLDITQSYIKVFFTTVYIVTILLQ